MTKASRTSIFHTRFCRAKAKISGKESSKRPMTMLFSATERWFNQP